MVMTLIFVGVINLILLVFALKSYDASNELIVLGLASNILWAVVFAIAMGFW
jgi:hypothetical protein